MSTSFRVAWFVVALALAFSAAYWLGQAVGPLGEPAPAHGSTDVHSQGPLPSGG